jgi:hypothetical protein
MIFCTFGASGVEFCVRFLVVSFLVRRASNSSLLFVRCAVIGVSSGEFAIFGFAPSCAGTASRSSCVPKQYRYCFAPFLCPEAVQVLLRTVSASRSSTSASLVCYSNLGAALIATSRVHNIRKQIISAGNIPVIYQHYLCYSN